MSPSGYDYWLFDLDGTVVDVAEGYIRDQFDRVGARLGRRFTDREARALWYGQGNDRDRLLSRLGVDRDAFWTAFDAVERPAERIAATTLYDDAAAALVALETPVGLVTHCQPRIAEPILDRFGITDRFDAVICCSEETGWKPDPAPLERAMAAIGVDQEHCGVMVGDGPSDVGAAKNAGIDGIRIDRHGIEPPIARADPVGQPHRLAEPDLAVPRLDAPPLRSLVEAG